MSNSRRLVFLLAVTAAMLLAAPGSQAACPAESFVKNAGGAMMGAARAGSPKAFANVAARYTDLRAIALFALGQHRDRMSKMQEAEYLSLTRAFVGRFMAKHAGRFNGTAISVSGCSGKGQAVTVNAKLSGGQKVVFRLSKTKGGYKVRDLNVSSVWLAQQLRTTFVGVISRGNGDMEALMRYLRAYT